MLKQADWLPVFWTTDAYHCLQPNKSDSRRRCPSPVLRYGTAAPAFLGNV